MSEVILHKQMLVTYVLRRSEDLKKLKAGLAAGSTDEFKRVGHQLLGNASSFGFDDLEPLAQEMEAVSSDNLSEKGPAILHQFSDWIEKTKLDLL